MAQAPQNTASDTAPKKGPSTKLLTVEAGSTKQALAAAEAGKQSILMIAPEHIQVLPGFQPRLDNAEYRSRVEDLTESMIEGGYLLSKPITAWVGKNEGGENTIYVTDGHTRLEAAKAAIEKGASIPQIPVIVLPAGTTMKELNAKAVRENENPGSKLGVLEKALIVKRLSDAGSDVAELRELLGFTDKWIGQLKLLMDAPKSLREYVKNGRIGGAEAINCIEDSIRKSKAKIAKDPEKGMKAAYALAEKEVKAAVASAAAQGRTKATRKDTSRGTRGGKSTRTDTIDAETGESTPRVKMAKHAVEWNASVGHEFELSEVKHFKGLFGDTDWYELSERAGWAKAVEAVSFKAVITRPEKPAGESAADEAETEGDEASEEAEEETEETEEEEVETADL